MDVRLPNGTIIRGVPDGTNKDEVMQKAVSAGLATKEDFNFRQQSSQPQRVEVPQLEMAEMARQNIAMPAVPGMQPMLPDADIIGVSRATEQTRALPEISSSGLLSGENQGKVSAISPVLLTTTDPNEIAQIISSNFPNIGVTYNKDAQGNIYPILANNKTGAVAQVNKPGISGMDVLQTLGIGAAFTPAGRAGTVIGAAGKAAATQAAIEVAQAASGGEFDTTPIVAAGFGGAAAQKLSSSIGSVFKQQSPAKQKIAQLVEQNSDNVQRAGFSMSIAESGAAKTTKDKAAQSLIRQKVDPGTVAVIQASSDADKSAMREALSILKKAMESKTYGVVNRPGDAAGKVLKKRYDAVSDINRKAGREINIAAANLEGKQLNVEPAYNDFLDSLMDLGVTIRRGKNGRLKGVYDSSEFAQSKSSQRILNDFIAKSETGQMDALAAHRMKRVIDGAVEYGKKSKNPILNKAESSLKSLRNGINGQLKDLSPEYKAANDKFSATRKALDDFHSAAGPSFNPKSENAEKQLVNTVRSIMSYNQKRVPAMDAINSLQEVAKSYGKTFDDDILKQAVFMDELETMFGSSAPISFGGQIEKAATRAITGSKKELLESAAAEGIKKLRGINEENLIKALEEILK